ncbi:P-type conjugative transfer protein TrbJ [Methylobacter svalbardensis]|uniref:P-type conjugative transfer protein TrbJ n=1 Tax=Methylobacter svalbardensis TaxID=3080016 RepID=UPI0030EE9734
MKKQTTHPAILFALVVSLGVSTPTLAVFGVGDVVFDPTNNANTLVSSMENVAQTLKQVEQYGTQLQQYENQLKNTVAPAAYIWDQANGTMNKLRAATDTLSYYKQQAGSIDGYLSKFQDVNYYKGSPCFSNGSCSPAERAAIQQTQLLGSQAQKKANDAMFNGLDQQQNNLQSDAAQLELLQSQASSADGQMKAIQAANQLSSNQANQLLQIRSLMIAQQNAMATKMQVDADREAQYAAASEQLRRSKYQKSPVVNWGIR